MVSRGNIKKSRQNQNQYGEIEIILQDDSIIEVTKQPRYFHHTRFNQITEFNQFYDIIGYVETVKTEKTINNDGYDMLSVICSQKLLTKWLTINQKVINNLIYFIIIIYFFCIINYSEIDRFCKRTFKSPY
jgi:hypothetical protein